MMGFMNDDRIYNNNRFYNNQNNEEFYNSNNNSGFHNSRSVFYEIIMMGLMTMPVSFIMIITGFKMIIVFHDKFYSDNDSNQEVYKDNNSFVSILTGFIILIIGFTILATGFTILATGFIV